MHLVESVGVSMDLNTIKEISHPQSRTQLPVWTAGDAWLAGGTWLFSEPQVHLTRLIDLTDLEWPALTIGEDGLTIAATCTVAQLDGLTCPPDWIAAPLINQCCRAFLASFKIWKTATVGGNICMSLPAGPMISLTVALEATYTLWPRTAPARQVPSIDFVTGNHGNILQPGELLRSIHLPASALSKRFAFRHASLTHLGRSAALLVGTQNAAGDDLLITITAATPRPIQLRFTHAPSATELRRTLDERIPADGYFDDVHGSAAYKRHLTRYFAEQIRAELAQPGARA
jgi:CO/xanthine dehydrogenase FAD-binding subunit